MPGWKGSTRRQRLPRDWPRIRQRILTRDRWQCTWRINGTPCGERATDVDHIIPGDDHRDENLASVCSRHHRRKSSSEGGQAAAEKRRRYPRRRPPEPHPGII